MGGCGTKIETMTTCTYSNKMVSYNEPSNHATALKKFCIERRSYDKMIEHCTARYKMELICIQTRLKGQGSPELTLKVKTENLNNWYRRQQFTFMNILGLD